MLATWCVGYVLYKALVFKRNGVVTYASSNCTYIALMQHHENCTAIVQVYVLLRSCFWGQDSLHIGFRYHTCIPKS